jgi:hypothetical protein
MAHWIRLPDGGYVNTDTLSAVGPQMPLIAPGQGHYRSYGTPDGYRSRAEGAAADALAAAIEAQQQQAVAPPPVAASAARASLDRWMVVDPVEPVPAPPAPPLDDPDALGSRDEFPGIRQLDLRQGDDVLALRYDGVEYVVAIKLRFGDAPEGLPDCYLEASFYNPHTRMWTLMQRYGIASPPTEHRFSSAVRTILGHDRAKALGE